MRILIALCGLLRSYQLVWPILSRQLRLDALRAEGRAETDVIVLTSLARGCTDADVSRDLCPREWSEMGAAERIAELRVTIGPRLRFVHGAELSDVARRFGRSLEARALDLIARRLLPARPEGAGSPTAAELASAAAGFFDAYAIVVFVRPDVVLVPPAPRSADRAFGTFDLIRTCAAYRGFELVSGSLYRWFWYHTRDWDFMHVLCPPVRVVHWLALDARANETCDAPGVCGAAPYARPPPRPPGYAAEWHSPLAQNVSRERTAHICSMPGKALCTRAAYFASRALPMIALPDALTLAHIVKLRRPGLEGAPRQNGAPTTANASAVAVPFAGWPWSWEPCSFAGDDERGLLCPVKRQNECAPYRPVILGGRPAVASDEQRVALARAERRGEERASDDALGRRRVAVHAVPHATGRNATGDAAPHATERNATGDAAPHATERKATGDAAPHATGRNATNDASASARGAQHVAPHAPVGALEGASPAESRGADDGARALERADEIAPFLGWAGDAYPFVDTRAYACGRASHLLAGGARRHPPKPLARPAAGARVPRKGASRGNGDDGTDPKPLGGGGAQPGGRRVGKHGSGDGGGRVGDKRFNLTQF